MSASIEAVAAPEDWLFTPLGEPRGYIQPHALTELWFHAGSACNLACPFCLEGSRPGDARIERIGFADAAPFLDEAEALGVRQLSFTGGEPFLVKDIVRILARALEIAPALVLTNGVGALPRRLAQLRALQGKPHPLSLRISLDFPDPQRHDAGRGTGSFAAACRTLQQLHAEGFTVSVARQLQPDEPPGDAQRRFRELFAQLDLPADLNIVAFPDFGVPGEQRAVPAVTRACMSTYQSESSRREFMCAYSKMLVKIGGRMRVYACTLVDDDPAYDQGGTLIESLGRRVMLRHHRCYACFKYGASCSETRGR